MAGNVLSLRCLISATPEALKVLRSLMFWLRSSSNPLDSRKIESLRNINMVNTACSSCASKSLWGHLQSSFSHPKRRKTTSQQHPRTGQLRLPRLGQFGLEVLVIQLWCRVGHQAEPWFGAPGLPAGARKLPPGQVGNFMRRLRLP